MNQSVPTPPPAPQDKDRSRYQPNAPLAKLEAVEEQALRRRLGSWSRFRRGVPPQDFDDVYQEAWCKVLDGERKGRPTRNREGALRWAVHNSWLEELRGRGRRPAVALDSAPEATLVADGAADPAERAELLEATRYLFEAVDAVSDRERQIFLLADVFGLRPREIQRRLEISERLYQLDRARALRAIGGRLGELLAGDWCEQHRELLAHAAGEASPSQERQARRHLTTARPAGADSPPPARPGRPRRRRSPRSHAAFSASGNLDT
jgi:RNA polymerase sigma factor (sigma-70 family)